MTCSALQPPSLHRIIARHEGGTVKSSFKPRAAINAGFIAITLTIALAFAAASSGAAELKPATIQAFNEYIQRSEARMAARQPGDNSFLWMDALPPQDRTKEYADLKQGQLIVQRSEEGDSSIGIAAAGGGLIHDWTGIVFVPGVTLAQTLALLEDYDRASEFYSPDVNKSKLLSRSGDDFRVYLRLTRKEVITVVFDTEYDVHYTWLDAAHARAARTAHASRKSSVPANPENATSPPEKTTDSSGGSIPTGGFARPMAASTFSAKPFR